ncbi:hypothetical protein NL676_027413 [Syzygium grande]|nr:hypothetical protein NL676_027413 [Syzygium grande]
MNKARSMQRRRRIPGFAIRSQIGTTTRKHEKKRERKNEIGGRGSTLGPTEDPAHCTVPPLFSLPTSHSSSSSPPPP